MSYIMKKTKFDILLSQIPKHTELWTAGDVAIWLSIIGMEMYVSNFSEMSIDGLLILDITEEDLENEVRVPIKLHRKKIIKAIDVLKEYNNYLNELISYDEPLENKNNIEEEMIQEEMLTADHHMGGNSKQSFGNDDNIIEEEMVPKICAEKSKSNKCITIKSLEGPTDMHFNVETDGIKIGRHSSNQIVIFDEGVSRYHAEIVFANEIFYLKDIGSTIGTFLKILEPLELKLGMIIEVGSYQLQVIHIEISTHTDSGSYVEFSVHDPPEEVIEKNFTLCSNEGIGRKTNNALSFTDDLHMSNIHCKIYLINDKFFLEDIESTNGTWLRLSPEGIISEPSPLEDGTVFKIGNSAMYEVADNKPGSPYDIVEENNNIKPDEGKQGNTLCSICWEEERNCVVLPCRHNVTCMKCVKGVKTCPICRTPIDDLYRIFKC